MRGSALPSDAACVAHAWFPAFSLHVGAATSFQAQLEYARHGRPSAGAQHLEICGQCATSLLHALCRVQGFPTIKAFINGRIIDYNGDRSAGHLKDWAISLIPQKVRARLTTGPEFGVALLFHRMVDGHMQECYHLFVIVLVTVLSSGSKPGRFSAALRGGKWEGEEGHQVWRDLMKHSW